MRFLLDHDVPAQVAQVLRQEGHEPSELREALPADAADLDVLALAQESGQFLITCNRDDFLVLAAARPNPGIIILIRRRTRHAECGRLLRLLREAGESGIAGNINFA